MTTCANGHANKDTHLYCGECGSPLLEVPFDSVPALGGEIASAGVRTSVDDDFVARGHHMQFSISGGTIVVTVPRSDAKQAEFPVRGVIDARVVHSTARGGIFILKTSGKVYQTGFDKNNAPAFERLAKLGPQRAPAPPRTPSGFDPQTGVPSPRANSSNSTRGWELTSIPRYAKNAASVGTVLVALGVVMLSVGFIAVITLIIRYNGEQYAGVGTVFQIRDVLVVIFASALPAFAVIGGGMGLRLYAMVQIANLDSSGVAQ